MHKDPYFCLSCNDKGYINGIITILSPCNRCGSLLILPLASLHMIEIHALQQSLPTLLAEERQYRKWTGRKHLRVVPNQDDDSEKTK